MGKWVLIVIALVAVTGVGVGVASRWEPAGVLNLVDRFTPGPAGQRVAEAVPYGRDPVQAVDVYVPAGTGTTDRRPVIVWFHGGGWNNGGRRQYAFAGRAFSSEGFVTVVAGYRLGEAGKFPRFMEDAAAAVRWTHDNIARYGGDPDRIVIAGHSAGGHIAALLALDDSWLGAMTRPGGAVRGVVGIAGPYDFLPFEPDGSAQKYLGHTRPLSRTQPVAYARGDAPPMLLLWGDADTLVQRRNITSLTAAQVAAGGWVESRIYPGIDHSEIVMALSRPYRDKAPVLRAVATFAHNVTRSAEAQASAERP